jgi:NADPH:quinone reductase-like Zn-dependent oxidoreductase
MRTEHRNGTGTGTASPTIAMQAVIHDEYGEAEDVLRLATIARPEIADGEVLVRVHAAGVDRGVWHVVAGRPYALRLAGYGVRKPKNPVAGRDVAGTVEAVGKDVTRFAPGQEVYGTAEGSFAEYARADQRRLAPKPANVTFAQAAALPISGLTALQGLRDRAQVRPGQHVLVIGASGGVGSYAVQIAVAFGATVTAVCSPAKADLVRALGAEHVIDYTRTAITAGPQRYDVVLDIGGHRSLGELRRALTPRGTLVIVGSETGGRWLGGFDRSLRAGLLSPFVGQELRMLTNSENSADLVALAGLVESGAVTPAIDRIYPLAQAAAAVQYMAHGHARGKVVITV